MRARARAWRDHAPCARDDPRVSAGRRNDVSEKTVHKVPIVSLDDPKYQNLARKVAFPDNEPQGAKFFPAFVGFNAITRSLSCWLIPIVNR